MRSRHSRGRDLAGTVVTAPRAGIAGVGLAGVGLARAGIAGAALVLVACHSTPRQTASGPYAALVAHAIPTIERGTGLTFKRPPVVQTRTRAQVHAFLERRFADQMTRNEIAGDQVLYRRLGLIPDTLDLGRFLLSLYTEQVSGFYDPATKVLYVVDGAPRDQLSFVVSHELVHALQDQYMNLDSIQHLRGESDRELAAEAVIEGQATLVPIEAALGPGANLPVGWDRVRQLIRENQSSMPVFARAPAILQETLLFPYLSGAEFMHRYDARRPHQVPYGAALPTSTTQILHPERYFEPHPFEPVELTLPPLPHGATAVYQDEMGEFETRVFLDQMLHDENTAARAADGWEGDRYVVLRTAHGTGLAWLTIWRSTIDAAEFSSAMEQFVAARYAHASPHTAASTTTFAVPGRNVSLRGATVGGHPAILYTDAPATSPTPLFRLTAVRLH